MTDYGYLQHGKACEPMRTERVHIRHQYADKWQARYEGRWRAVHVQLRRLYIVYRGERISIAIEGI